MGDPRVRTESRAPVASPAPPSGPPPAAAPPPPPPTPAEARDQAAADLDAARDRAARLRPRRPLPPPPEVRLERPSLRPPAGEVRLTERELVRAAPDLRVQRDPAVPELPTVPTLADLPPAERRGVEELVARFADALADDGAPRLEPLVRPLNLLRQAFHRGPIRPDDLHAMVSAGVVGGVQAGAEKLLELVLRSVFGEPAERPHPEDPFGTLEPPAPVERLHEDEQRFYLDLPAFPWG